MAKIYAPNERYTGISAGVSFSNGVGVTEDKWLVQWFKYKGYKVVEDEPEGIIEADGEEPMATDEKLEEMTVAELKEKAKEKNIPNYAKMKKDELIKALKG